MDAKILAFDARRFSFLLNVIHVHFESPFMYSWYDRPADGVAHLPPIWQDA
jgi:hypothetical protein